MTTRVKASATRAKAAAEPAAAPFEPTSGNCWLINPGRSGRVYNVAGHSLGGGERVEVDGCYTGLDAVGQTAVDRGYLILRVITPPPPPPDPTPPVSGDTPPSA